MHQADGADVAGCTEPDHGEARNRLLESASDSATGPDLSDIQTPRSNERDLSHVYLNDDLDIPVVELGFGQVNHHRAHARADLGQTAHLPAALEANLAHRSGDLQRLLTAPRGWSEFERRWEAANHGGELGIGTGPQQLVEGAFEGVLTDLAADQESLQDLDLALPKLLGDRRLVDREPVIAHASTLPLGRKRSASRESMRETRRAGQRAPPRERCQGHRSRVAPWSLSRSRLRDPGDRNGDRAHFRIRWLLATPQQALTASLRELRSVAEALAGPGPAPEAKAIAGAVCPFRALRNVPRRAGMGIPTARVSSDSVGCKVDAPGVIPGASGPGTEGSTSPRTEIRVSAWGRRGRSEPARPGGGRGTRSRPGRKGWRVRPTTTTHGKERG